MEISVIAWKWGTRYPAEYVNRLYRGLQRNLHLPFRLYCITDDSRGLDDGIRVFTYPMNGARCRRLKLFDKSLYDYIGQRILQMDLDCVITGDITPLVDRTEPFIIWESVHLTRWIIGAKAPGYIGGALVENTKPASNPYNASMFLMDAGVMPNLWDEYRANPELVEDMAKQAGHWTAIVRQDGRGVLLKPGDDDQAIITLYAKRLHPKPATWGEGDGIYKYKRIKPGLPADARVVFFQGRDIQEQASQSPWILEHWA